MCYTLPKIWTGRIQKYWDKIMPSDIPVSDSEFSLRFNSDEEKAAVDTFEAQLGTEQSVVAAMLPDNTVMSNYCGVYEVTGTPNVLTLLFPEKVTTDRAIVMHYNVDDDSWTKVENIQIIDGYIWGKLASFSPIAVVEYKREIHSEASVTGVKTAGGAVVCEGNAVQVKYDPETQKTFVLNPATGKKIELTSKTTIIGGSIDGTPVEKTSISVSGLLSNAIVGKIIAGSLYVPEDKTKFTTVGEVHVYCADKVVGCLTGSFGAVRTDKVTFDLHNCTAGWIGAGEGFAGLNQPGTKMASTALIKEVYMVLDNVKSGLTYVAQNCEYFYTDKAYAKVTGGEHDYLLGCGSNEGCGEVDIYAEDAKIGIYQHNNRGLTEVSTATFKNCVVEKLFLAGDATDSTVNGTNNKIRVDIEAGEGVYNILRGTINGTLMTSEQVHDIVECVKVSRNAGTVVIADDLVKDLGNKYIIK